MRSLEVLDRSPYPLVDAFAELERPNSITKMSRSHVVWTGSASVPSG